MALNNSDRLIQLINNILDLERLESDAVELGKEKCLIAEIFKQAIEAVLPLANQHAIAIQVRSPEIAVEANFGAIVQTVTNLLSNAIKFSPSNATIWVKAEIIQSGLPEGLTDSPRPYPSFQPPTPYLLISITDQGRGIPPEKQEIIFGRFQQVDASDARQKGGTGLGLAICKTIVQQHDGHIWVESTLNAGSTFYFTLPLSTR
jgi:signal transduction histidine kinase